MRLVICGPYVEPEARWRRIGRLYGGDVELYVEGDTAYVRVDDYVKFSARGRLVEELTTLVERHTGDVVMETGPPILR